MDGSVNSTYSYSIPNYKEEFNTKAALFQVASANTVKEQMKNETRHKILGSLVVRKESKMAERRPNKLCPLSLTHILQKMNLQSLANKEFLSAQRESQQAPVILSSGVQATLS